MGAYTLRQSPAGGIIRGGADLDVLIWSDSTGKWVPGPQTSGVALAGDCSGASNDNRVRSLTGTAGGEMVALGDMSTLSDRRVLLLRDPSPDDTSEYRAISETLVTGWDGVFSSRTELAARFPPVGGVFTVSAGRYFIASNILLEADEQILISGNVTFESLGLNANTGFQRIPVSTTPMVRCPANTSIQLLNIRIWAQGGGVALQYQPNRTSPLVNASIQTATGGVAIEHSGAGGRLDMANCNVFPNISHTAGSIRAVNVSFSGTYSQTGGSNPALFAQQCLFASFTAGAPVISVQATSGTLEACDCTYSCSLANTDLINLAAPSGSVKLIGGQTTGNLTNAAAVRLSGVTREVNITDLTVQTAQHAVISADALAHESVIVKGMRLRNVTNGVTFPVASIPTRGLKLIGCDLNATTPISGFTAATARVVLRANNDAAGAALSETAIVP